MKNFKYPGQLYDLEHEPHWMWLQSSENATDIIEAVGEFKDTPAAALVGSHKDNISFDAAMTCLPSDEYATAQMSLCCPADNAIGSPAPVFMFQMWTEPLVEPETTQLQSGDMATAATVLPWPSNVAMHFAHPSSAPIVTCTMF